MIDKEYIEKLLNQLRELDITYKKTNSEYLIGDKQVPRVTEVLSAMIHEDSIVNWANGLGWKRISYRTFMKEAADKGTYAHLAVERFIRNGGIYNIDEMQIMDDHIRNSVESSLSAFEQWWMKLNYEYKDIKVIYLEETLIHKYFGGTCDCLLQVDGEYWLIDFKTSNHMSYNYALQLSAYRYLLKELKNIDIDKAIILRLDKTNFEYETFELDTHNEEHRKFMDECLEAFILMVGAYQGRLYTTQEYKKIFG